MSTKITKQKLPEWFNGELYEEGDTVRNRFSGEEYKLSAMELSMYDYIIGATTMMEMGMRHDGMIIDLRKGLDWFKQHNAEAYMVLLD
jgi:hypothetical protein